ncbi:Hypothetical protein SRAE_X000232000 [Strongyloides ratti]|uniref:Uncharacterized protein n=1 Tax=Strongyloides ratti TaxID=34506 RepID=A0A090KSV9_STRRB|nr:Hypothetical protein SRAE_X000232000 [Strongyloides ratti]CEF60585.1 Hypothetical protein SRAE_X000232000 [Strongyloides ratti]
MIEKIKFFQQSAIENLEGEKENSTRVMYFKPLYDIIKSKLETTFVDQDTNILIEECCNEEVSEASIKKFKALLAKLFFDLQIDEIVGRKLNKYKIFINIMEILLLGKSRKFVQHHQLRSCITSKKAYKRVVEKYSTCQWIKYSFDDLEKFIAIEENIKKIDENLEKEFSIKYNIGKEKIREIFDMVFKYYQQKSEKENTISLCENSNDINMLLEDLGLTKMILPEKISIDEVSKKKIVMVKREGLFYLYFKENKYKEYTCPKEALYKLMLLSSVTRAESCLSFAKIMSLFGLVYNADESKFLGPKLKYHDKSVQIYKKIKSSLNI